MGTVVEANVSYNEEDIEILGLTLQGRILQNQRLVQKP
jgi:hypothetical protein